MPTVRIGISGWRYPPWRGVFYPRGLPQRRELEYAAEHFTSVELNGSFYSLQRPSSYLSWYDQTPPGFVFSVKGGRFITHMRKLAGVETALANFFGSGVLALRKKLGPILWQVPPTLGFHPDRLAEFFELLPRSTTAAAHLAEHHDDRLTHEPWTALDVDRPLQHVIEVRHDTFRDPAFTELARAHGIGVVVADTAGKWPLLMDATVPLAYVRLHGDSELYTSGYDDAALDLWAERVRAWHGRGADVYVYFDNDVKVRAPFDAIALSARLADLLPGGAT